MLVLVSSKILPHHMLLVLKFLIRTKEGKYAPIEKSSLRFSRIKEETEVIEAYEEEYYYAIS
jgi:hypothetical protein